ncbi:hypothetical protein ACIBI9_18460 [Nonomuraea sp. NPDC050451]|uniref:hypothetical protein n=1 Tax=Nonomuraea sp. NPDC050451 TaxID=3364364 RepID=UPI0037903F42
MLSASTSRDLDLANRRAPIRAEGGPAQWACWDTANAAPAKPATVRVTSACATHGSFSYRMRSPRTRALRSKADQDPATWMPPDEAAHGRYATEWTAIKIRWELSIDPAEQQALNDLANACPTQRLPATDDQP